MKIVVAPDKFKGSLPAAQVAAAIAAGLQAALGPDGAELVTIPVADVGNLGRPVAVARLRRPCGAQCRTTARHPVGARSDLLQGRAGRHSSGDRRRGLAGHLEPVLKNGGRSGGPPPADTSLSSHVRAQHTDAARAGRGRDNGGLHAEGPGTGLGAEQRRGRRGLHTCPRLVRPGGGRPMTVMSADSRATSATSTGLLVGSRRAVADGALRSSSVGIRAGRIVAVEAFAAALDARRCRRTGRRPGPAARSAAALHHRGPAAAAQATEEDHV